MASNHAPGLRLRNGGGGGLGSLVPKEEGVYRRGWGLTFLLQLSASRYLRAPPPRAQSWATGAGLWQPLARAARDLALSQRGNGQGAPPLLLIFLFGKHHSERLTEWKKKEREKKKLEKKSDSFSFPLFLLPHLYFCPAPKAAKKTDCREQIFFYFFFLRLLFVFRTLSPHSLFFFFLSPLLSASRLPAYMDIKDLINKPERPRVYLDVAIGSKPVGRAIFQLVSLSHSLTSEPSFDARFLEMHVYGENFHHFCEWRHPLPSRNAPPT